MAAANPRPFLGRGIIRPFRRDQKNDIANDNGIDLIRACVGQVLGTRAADGAFANQGELPWRQAFGSRLYLLKHRKGPMLTELARIYVTEALALWEPRVILTAIGAAFDNEGRVLTIQLRYNVIEKNVPGNNVLYAGVEQTIQIPLAA